MSWLKLLLLSGGLAILSCAAIAQSTYYADVARPDDSGDGTSWATAKKTIQAPVDLAQGNDCVLVADVIYDAGDRATPGYALANRLVITNAVIVRSVNGPEYTSIVGSGPCGPGAVRCVYLSGGGKITPDPLPGPAAADCAGPGQSPGISRNNVLTGQGGAFNITIYYEGHS